VNGDALRAETFCRHWTPTSDDEVCRRKPNKGAFKSSLSAFAAIVFVVLAIVFTLASQFLEGESREHA